MMKKIWIATAVDHDADGNCDGKARVIGACLSEQEAKELVRQDIESWVDDRANEGVECDFDRMRAWYDYCQDVRCEWNVSEAEMPA